MTWHFTPHTHQQAAPVDNGEDILNVVENPRGGWSLRFSNSEQLIGKFTSIGEAETYARSQCRNVHVVPPARRPLTQDDMQHILSTPAEKAVKLIHSV